MDAPTPADETPATILDAIRGRPDWPEARRDEAFERLIARFTPAELAEEAKGRFGDLGGADGSVVLRLVESLATPDLLEALAGAIRGGAELPAERAYEALDLLDGAGLLEAYPDLAERREELEEVLMDEAGSLETLAEQLEEDPEGSWVALQGLSAVEPEVRAEIVEGLARGPVGPGLVSFLRLLAFAHDDPTRSAALRGLESISGDDPATRAAWESIAADHPDGEVVARARGRVGQEEALPARRAPRLLEALVTAIDGDGLAYVVLAAEDRGQEVACAFGCDALRGIVEVAGQEGDAGSWLAEFGAQPGRDAVADRPELALGLLAGSLLLCGPGTPPALRYWLERTVGAGFRPRPFPHDFGEADPIAIPAADLPGRAEAVLDACPTWIDRSELTAGLAEEIELREGEAPADPRRDAGAYRYLFEHQLQGKLELYRRMLLWMAAFWQGAGSGELALSAFALGWQLSDPQHAVPGHPFTVALTTRSLEAARGELRGGGERKSQV